MLDTIVFKILTTTGAIMIVGTLLAVILVSIANLKHVVYAQQLTTTSASSPFKKIGRTIELPFPNEKKVCVICVNIVVLGVVSWSESYPCCNHGD